MTETALEPFGELVLNSSCEELWWKVREKEFWEDVLESREAEEGRDAAGDLVYSGLAAGGWSVELEGCPLRGAAKSSVLTTGCILSMLLFQTPSKSPCGQGIPELESWLEI